MRASLIGFVLYRGKSLQTTYTLSNGGELPLPWSLYYNHDGVVAATPTSGTLTAGEEADVTVSLSDTAGLDQGRYRNLLQFKNDFEGAIGQSHLGSQERAVSVNVLPPDFPPPFNVSGMRIATGAARLWWDYDPAAAHRLRGFRIWYTTDPDMVNWSPSLDQIDPKARTGVAISLPSRGLYLSVEAFGADPMLQQAFSEPVFVSGVAEPTPGFPLNDTGITQCGNATQNNLPCPVSGFPGQDAQSGRDVTLNDPSDGHAGFSFTKISNSGNPLPNSATLGSGPNDWACTRDNVTGLIWEVKTNSGLRHQNWTYSWYNPDPGSNGGSAGYPDYDNYCFDSARCDTHKFVADVNSQGLCGARDWRLPDSFELESIISNERYNPAIAIDTAFFPNTRSGWFWSSSPTAYNANYAWFVDFRYGDFYGYYKNSAMSVRLVRGGQ